MAAGQLEGALTIHRFILQRGDHIAVCVCELFQHVVGEEAWDLFHIEGAEVGVAQLSVVIAEFEQIRGNHILCGETHLLHDVKAEFFRGIEHDGAVRKTDHVVSKTSFKPYVAVSYTHLTLPTMAVV